MGFVYLVRPWYWVTFSATQPTKLDNSRAGPNVLSVGACCVLSKYVSLTFHFLFSLPFGDDWRQTEILETSVNLYPH